MLKLKANKFMTVLAVSATIIFTSLAAQSSTNEVAIEKISTENIEKGKKLFFAANKGNCIACHAVVDGNLPGNTGPMIIAMKIRYPDRQKLFDKLWGTPDTLIPNSMMPPFGQNGILTNKEIDKIVDFIYGL